MKQTKTRVLCLLLAALMLLSLTACGKDKTSADPNLLKVGDYTLLYKGAYITEDYDGAICGGQRPQMRCSAATLRPERPPFRRA